MNKEMIISSTPHETRVAILEDDQVVEIFIEREHSRGVVGNVYKGRVSKVLPGMQSAFVDLGLERDAFLYVSDVISPSEESLEDDDEMVPAPEPTLTPAHGVPAIHENGERELDASEPADEAAERSEAPGGDADAFTPPGGVRLGSDMMSDPSLTPTSSAPLVVPLD